MNIAIPPPLKAEHDELHAELATATKLPGPVGSAAAEVAKLLHPHFIKEEQFALPPLGLLSDLAAGKWPQGIEAVLAMTERLKDELPMMLAEHVAILAALEKLAEAARIAGDEARLNFAHKLAAHARTEEVVLYPAAILVGEWVRRMGNEANRGWSGAMTTSDEDFHSCERSDQVLMALLGKTLGQGTIRLGLILLAICAAGAAVSELVTKA